MLTHKDKHTIDDAIFEEHLQTTQKRSTLVVKGYAYIKEERKRLF